MTLSLFFDILIVFLLTLWMAYALYLGQRLARSKEDQRRLTHLLEQFYQAVQKAQAEMTTLQQITQTTRQQLASDIARAAEIHHALQEIMPLKERIPPSVPTTPSATEATSPDSVPVSEEELIKALNALR